MDSIEALDASSSIQDFYAKSGMSRQEAFVFLLTALNKIKEVKNYEKEGRSRNKTEG